MPQQKTASLTTVLSDVLADLAFMFTDDTECATAEDVCWLQTTIGYCGPTSGTLELLCTRTFTIALAANLLGIDGDDDEAENAGDDSVKEFMNIVCGQLVTAWHGTQDIYNLTIPQICATDHRPGVCDTDDECVAALSVEGERIELRYFPGDQEAGA